jgi:hypothetical protein
MMIRLPWPLPALLAWGCAWALFAGLQWFGLPAVAALAVACTWGVALSLLGGTWWRRLLIGLGFPLSLLLAGGAAFPAWAWLLPLAVLLLIYPLNAWRDAPLFPTPANALDELAATAPLPIGALVLDAGCGLGDGLKALRQAYPAAQLHGLEWSWPLRFLSALRCPWASIRQGDIWRANWHALCHGVPFSKTREHATRRRQSACRTRLRCLAGKPGVRGFVAATPGDAALP